EFQGQVRIKGILAMQPVGRGRPFVVPGFLVDRVDAEHLQLASFDLWGQGVDHAAIFVFEEPAAGGWENGDGETCVAVGQQFHLTPERRAVPLDVIATHVRAAMNFSYRTLNNWPY